MKRKIQKAKNESMAKFKGLKDNLKALKFELKQLIPDISFVVRYIYNKG